MEINGKRTNNDKAIKLGDQLYNLISNMEKTDNIYPFPILEFNKSLEDEDFHKIIEEAINYICGKMNSKYTENLKVKLANYKTQIKNFFNNNKLIKDILENALITILTNEKEKLEEQKNNFSLLSVQNISICPLVNLPFKYNGIKIDLNKDDIIETATSNITILF